MKPLLKAKFPVMTAGNQLLARDLEFSIFPNEIVGLFGPNGCGKSVTLDALCGLRTIPDSTIQVDGIELQQSSMLKRWKLGMRRLFQEPALPVDCTFGTVMAHYSSMSQNQTPRNLKPLGRLPVSAEQQIGNLSYGQRRLAEMSAMSLGGRVFLLDEPFAGIAEILHKDIYQEIYTLTKYGCVLLVDHSRSRLASLASRTMSWPELKESSLPVRIECKEYNVKSLLMPMARKAPPIQWWVEKIIAGDRTLIKRLEVRAEPGDLIYLLGPNGSGKSSLLRALAGIPQPNGIRCLAVSATLKNVQKHFSPQPPKMISDISSEDCIKLMLSPDDSKSRERMETVRRLIDIAGIGQDILTKKCNSLSGGEAALMSLIGATASSRQILLLDEPFEGMSAGSLAFARHLIVALKNAGSIIIAATHSSFLEGLEGKRIQMG